MHSMSLCYVIIVDMPSVKLSCFNILKVILFLHKMSFGPLFVLTLKDDVTNLNMSAPIK